MNLKLLRRLTVEQLPAFLLAFILEFIILVFYCITIAGNTAIEYKIQIWIYGCGPVDFFMPLFASLPFSFSLYYKRYGGFLDYAGARIDRKRYVIHHMLSGFFLCFIGTIIVYYGALVISEFLLSPVAVTGYSSGLENYVFGNMQISHPMIFGLFWCIWKGFNAGLFTIFGYRLALCLDNVFLVSILPFIYYIAENLMTSLLQIPQYSIVTSVALNRLAPQCMHIYNYLIGTCTFMLFSSVIILLIKGKGKTRL